ncbi:MAG TPA: hypothetical protein ENK54_05770 [Thiotrichales bacterium]|nr:hypothetical protein [Thiotrichales bacterium]
MRRPHAETGEVRGGGPGHAPASLLLLLVPILFLVAGTASAGCLQEVPICYGYGCRHTGWLPVDEGRCTALERWMASARDAASERERLAGAIALLESWAALHVPVGEDLAGSYPWGGLPGQQDCIDESLNTDRFLRLLDEAGLLRWHRPAGRQRRAPRLVDVHWTAVIRERATGRSYAVDSWLRDNGEAAVILPLEAWREAEPPSDRPLSGRSERRWSEIWQEEE